jgi:hypothetical protein
LLVCLGDSWTWGSGLGNTNISAGIDDTQFRVSNMYGHHLATSLNADFVNIATPGWSNLVIFKKLQMVLPAVVHKYRVVYLVITLSENCREFVSANCWPIRVDFSQEPSSLYLLLEQYEARMFQYFKELINQYPTVRATIGRNFTYTYESNLSILDGMQAEKTWIDVIADYQQLPGYPKNLRILSQQAYAPLEKYLKTTGVFNRFKMEVFDIFSDMTDAMDWLDKSELNLKEGSRYPTSLAHKLWAEYLLTCL